MKQKFEADDGTPFETAAGCKEYEEQETLIGLLTDMSREDILSALSRINIPVADALERIGNLIAVRRLESGELRRKRKKGGLTL